MYVALIVSWTWMAGAASRAGDTDYYQVPGLTAGSWRTGVFGTLYFAKWQFIVSFVHCIPDWYIAVFSSARFQYKPEMNFTAPLILFHWNLQILLYIAHSMRSMNFATWCISWNLTRGAGRLTMTAPTIRGHVIKL